MATFAQNINKIRGEAVYGDEMRTAIADAIEQTMGLDISGASSVVVLVSQIEDEDYELRFIPET